MRFLVLLLLLSTSSFAQMSVKVEMASAIDFSSPPRVIGNRVLFKTDTKLAEGRMAFIAVDGPYDIFDVVAKRLMIVNGAIVTEYGLVKDAGSAKEFTVTGSGEYTIEIQGYSSKRIEHYPPFQVSLDPPVPPKPPEPPKPPTPDVPTDPFDNLGQRVALWGAGLPKTKEVAAIYLKYGNALADDPKVELVASFLAVGQERLGLLGADGPKYNDATNKINADLASRGAMAKGTAALYLKAIAAGYAGAK